MWASDDNHGEPNFVSLLARCLNEDARFVLAAAEALHGLADRTRPPLFREGSSFNEGDHCSHCLRMLTFILPSGGNLIYEPYRPQSLLPHGQCTASDVCAFIREIPILLQVAARWTIRVWNKVLFYRPTSLPTSLQGCGESGLAPDLDAPQGARNPSRSDPSLRGSVGRGVPSDRSGSVIASSPRWVLPLVLYLSGVWGHHVHPMIDVARMTWAQATTSQLGKLVV